MFLKKEWFIFCPFLCRHDHLQAGWGLCEMLILYSHQATLMFTLCFILSWTFISFSPLWPSQLNLWQHRYTSNTAFILSFWLNLFQPPICMCVCVCVWIFTCKKRGRAGGMQGNIFTTCNPFEDNSSLLLRCVGFFFFCLFREKLGN